MTAPARRAVERDRLLEQASGLVLERAQRRGLPVGLRSDQLGGPRRTALLDDDSTSARAAGESG